MCACPKQGRYDKQAGLRQSGIKPRLWRGKIPIDLSLLKGDFQFPLLEKGRCEKIENWKIDYLKSLMIFFPKPRFPQFFHSFRGR
jgi:hypothetical protein